MPPSLYLSPPGGGETMGFCELCFVSQQQADIIIL